jgi:hypothetical protein
MMSWRRPSRALTRRLHWLSLPLAVVLLVVAAVPPAQAVPTPQGNPPGGATFTPEPGKLSPLPILKFDNSQPKNFDQALPKMSQMEPLVRDLQGKLDASQFDLDALGASLDYDPAKIVAFVRTQIAFEQYPGVLRGEFGTLIGRAGNAFDILPKGIPLALRAFGNREGSYSCRTDLEIPLAPLDPAKVKAVVNALQPQKLGATPIAASF